MRGYAPRDDLASPAPWLNSDGTETKFPFSGDPVSGTGEIDSNPGDRRMLLNTGPFFLAVGDTQDIIFSITGGIGTTNLFSVNEMKLNGEMAENFINSLVDSSFIPDTLNGVITWYPGDTDHNGVVDENDIISIGMYFQETIDTVGGTNSFVWLPRSSIDGLTINNLMMADVNDDGIVDERDVVGIGVHWGNTYATESGSRSLWQDVDIYSLSEEQKIGFKMLYNSLSGDSEPINEMRTLLKTILGIGLPSEFSLEQNYPNPFNAATTLKFSLPKPAVVNLSIYNVIGQIVDVPISNVFYLPGLHSISYRNNSLSSGVYFIRMDLGEWSSIKKIMLLK